MRYDARMSTVEHEQQANPLGPVFGLKHKSELIDYCAGLEVSSRDLLEIVLRGRAGEFGAYNYVCHVLDAVPNELGLSNDDMQVLSRTGQGLLPRDQRLIERIFLTLDTSRIFAAHMFYSTDWAFWYVLGFDRRESASMRGKTLYLISDHFGLPIDQVWAQVVSGRPDFPKLAITYRQACSL
jgi:hypothetical protein